MDRRVTKFRSPLAQVIGLGTAKEGSAHWWWQRLTAVALVPLTIWFTYSLATLTGPCIDTIDLWLQSPVSTTLLIAFVVSLFHHTQLGLQVVLEDYIHHEALKIFSILFVKAIAIMLTILSTISILQVALR